jgi:hypothetical protein
MPIAVTTSALKSCMACSSSSSTCALAAFTTPALRNLHGLCQQRAEAAQDLLRIMQLGSMIRTLR